MRPVEQIDSVALERRKVVVADIALLYRLDSDTQRLILGDDYKTKLDKLAVYVAAYLYAVNWRSSKSQVLLAPSVIAGALPAPSIEVVDSVAPSLDLVIELRSLNYQIDIDALSEDDACDVSAERDWCDYWYAWHCSQLDGVQYV